MMTMIMMMRSEMRCNSMNQVSLMRSAGYRKLGNVKGGEKV